MQMSKDTLLRGGRARAPAAKPASRVIGIDDWVWKRGIAMAPSSATWSGARSPTSFPTRGAAAVEAWLRDRPNVEIVSRNPGGGNGQAVARRVPNPTQVADRWRLMENASRSVPPHCAAVNDAAALALSAGR
jgi:transposase